MNRCMKCMEVIQHPNSVCPYCGFDELKYNAKPEYLPIHSELAGGRYVIGIVTGEDNMKITYIAYDNKFDCAVSIKEFFLKDYVVRHDCTRSHAFVCDPSADENAYRQKLNTLQTGASRIANLAYQSAIIPVKDLFRENNTLYIVEEYINGIPMTQYLKERGGKIPMTECLEMFRPILLGVATVQKEHIIYKNISLENILVRDDGRLMLTGFSPENDIISTGSTLKIGYTPLEVYKVDTDTWEAYAGVFEQNSYNSVIGPWVDVYSLSVCIYNCVSGKKAADATIMGSDKNIWDGISVDGTEAQKAAIAKGMELDYTHRLQSVQDLYNCLFLNMPIPDKNIKETGKSKTKAKKKKTDNQHLGRRIIAAVIITVAVMTLIGGGVYYYINEIYNVTNIAVMTTSVHFNATANDDGESNAVNISAGESIVDLIPTSASIIGEWTVSAESDNTNVAKIEDGTILPVGEGDTTVSYTAEVDLDGGGINRYTGMIIVVVE